MLAFGIAMQQGSSRARAGASRRCRASTGGGPRNVRNVLFLPPEGWFYASKYGQDASSAAFLIVQHGNLELWRRFVPVLEPLMAKGEVKGTEYALMFDRLALAEGRPQRYGSQMTCKNGKFVVDKLADPEHVEERRKTMGSKTTLPEYVQHFANFPPCG